MSTSNVTDYEMITLPYYTDPETLPHPLPSKDEIDKSSSLCADQTYRRVVAVGEHFVVKYGHHLELLEGENMIFVARNTSLYTPKVYALFHDDTDGKNYLIMERIKGHTLTDLWPDLSQTQKAAISSKLRQAIEELRNLPSPGYFGSIGRRPMLDGMFWTGNGDKNLHLDGPFNTEEELNDAFTELCLAGEYPPPAKAEFYRIAFRNVFRGHPSTFTHGDIQQKNIMVKHLVEGRSGDEPDDWEVVIIDWETAGWKPSYWEYAQAIGGCGIFKNDWSDWVGKFLEPYLNEYAWHHMLVCDVWG